MPAANITSHAGLDALWSISGWFGLVVYIVVAIALWRVFDKAGYPGILAIIPIVNMFFLVKVGGMSAWWGLLFFVPIVNVVFWIVVSFRVGSSFGKGGVFSFFLLWLLPFIGYMILGFGSARHSAPARY